MTILSYYRLAAKTCTVPGKSKTHFLSASRLLDYYLHNKENTYIILRNKNINQSSKYISQ